MKVLIDEDLHRSLGSVLSSLGFIVLDIRDEALRGSSDERVYEYAQKQKAVLFSADLGFSNILQFPLGAHYGIVVLRFPNEMSTKTINNLVKKLLEKLHTEDYQGNCIILSPGRIRIRRNKDRILV
ncbi:hypothetical protein A2966_02945 [Candidatus Roizmanbacteria bacterium RIFCSPLOWO2_01_FULL_41_22]|uniref:DUF5615 domain-containing protein n=1 Tax=Candidatus Roizmanbacteria bacterium RIFCSPLOWO2_01_FULL_41_22 TaxID=1802067 RepID=A0A1F7J7K6_9BACT|nr:MAG: hypothetical protein A2966_02945 [Candidatus Roizmanbacteria bacterium RIFCSPLOWO2_01_FULL_41_22]